MRQHDEANHDMGAFALFFLIRGGQVPEQRNYDWFAPW